MNIEAFNADRAAKLADVQWRIDRYRELAVPTTETAAKYLELLAYKQTLRDIPLQAGFPDVVNWPPVP